MHVHDQLKAQLEEQNRKISHCVDIEVKQRQMIIERATHLSFRWLVCGKLAKHPYFTSSKVRASMTTNTETVVNPVDTLVDSMTRESAIVEQNWTLRHVMAQLWQAWSNGQEPPTFIPSFLRSQVSDPHLLKSRYQILSSLHAIPFGSAQPLQMPLSPSSIEKSQSSPPFLSIGPNETYYPSPLLIELISPLHASIPPPHLVTPTGKTWWGVKYKSTHVIIWWDFLNSSQLTHNPKWGIGLDTFKPNQHKKQDTSRHQDVAAFKVRFPIFAFSQCMEHICQDHGNNGRTFHYCQCLHHPCQMNVDMFFPFGENDEPKKRGHESQTSIHLPSLYASLIAKLIMELFGINVLWDYRSFVAEISTPEY
ncbi:hypothetical protein H5410_004482 [Solanum commersonii]|uniref:Uncharacterized protein n=1 Tax=Solanum commersonii TaxID=4109 RepID=A0A9J6B7H3_SOLCO|nr:hypothetical protein H5410_004482 [Solanum commersonii]